MAVTVSTAVLEQLSRFESDGHPVLSVYFDLDPGRFPTPAERAAELSALLSSAGAHDADAARVRDAVASHPELAHGAHGVAIFSCAAADALEVLALPEPVEPFIVVDTVPWLEPLAAMVTREHWGVAVISRPAARLFRGGSGGWSSLRVSRTTSSASFAGRLVAGQLPTRDRAAGRRARAPRRRAAYAGAPSSAVRPSRDRHVRSALARRSGRPAR